MTARRNIIIAVGAIEIFAAIVGFFITLDVSPQIAYARLFIDLGLAIGLMAVIMAFYREKPLPTEPIIQVIKKLMAGKYKARISINESELLAPLAKAVNELAKSLDAEHSKQEEIKRNLREELLPGIKQVKEPTIFDHSIHPELGPVLHLPEEIREQKYKNTLIESKPPEAKVLTKVPVLEDQDLGELYQRFIEAQREYALDQIEYPAFLKTIDCTRKELISSFQCRDIIFDIVCENKQVALQPKIIR